MTWLILEMASPLRLFACRFLELWLLKLTVVPAPLPPLSAAFFWMVLLPDRSRARAPFLGALPVTSKLRMESLYAKAAAIVLIWKPTSPQEAVITVAANGKVATLKWTP